MLFPSLRERWLRLRTRLPRWLVILGYAGRDFVVDDGLHWSSSIAFYGALSLLPLVLAAVDIAAWFTDPHTANQQAGEILRYVVPHAETVRDVVDRAITTRHHTNPLSVLVLLYAGGRTFSVLTRALNVAYDVNEAGGFFRRLLVEIGILFALGLLFVGALLASLLLPGFGRGTAPAPPTGTVLGPLVRWLVPALLLLGGLFCLYKFVPRRRCNWQSALLGALVAGALCAGAKPLFLFYVDRLASYNQIYGWLTIGVVFMVWAELVAIIILYGGELASHAQMMVYDGLSGQEVSRQHRRRSPGRSPPPTAAGPGVSGRR